MSKPRPSLEDRFWRYTDKRGPDECWPWTGVRNEKGYGRIAMERTGRLRNATRVSWEIANGQPFPPELLACHTCDNPTCVNPAHIWPGTASENRRDAEAKGRIRNGRRRYLECPNCRHKVPYAVPPRLIEYPPATGSFSGWGVRRANRSYPCQNEDGCSRTIVTGSLYAFRRTYGFGGRGYVARALICVCSVCAGIETESLAA